jgi:hypothetical protein
VGGNQYPSASLEQITNNSKVGNCSSSLIIHNRLNDAKEPLLSGLKDGSYLYIHKNISMVNVKLWTH